MSRIENELVETKSAKEKLQEENELLKLKLERLHNKNQRLKDEKNDISRKEILMEVKYDRILAGLVVGINKCPLMSFILVSMQKW